MSFLNYIGQTLDGKYQIESEIGRGGMGTVFLATHLGTERPVAVKIIAPQFMQRAEFVERFRREARAAGRLRHPNVVNVTDFGLADSKDGKIAYLVMEYLDGCTLGEVLEEEKNLPVNWTIDILEQVCSAVHEAHQQGIIHRDLKPDNIWLEPNPSGGYTVKVLDFGIAKLEENMSKSANLPADYQPILPPISPARATVADFDQNTTIADARVSTAVFESATIAQTAESKTFSSESGTMIQQPSEAGTMIQVVAVESIAEDKTAIFAGNQTIAETQEDVGTRLITDQIPSENSSENDLTDNSIRQTKNTSELTRVGAVLGTPLFMSPEQVRGEKLSARSDIYSLGIIAYRMLGGKTPFDGDFQSVMDSHKDLEPPPLVAKKVPKKVKAVVMSALSKNSDERPPTAQAFASELRAGNEGIGELLRKSLVIYSENLPKFLLIATLAILPAAVLTCIRFSFNLMRGLEVISDNSWMTLISGTLSVLAFFVQIFCAAFLVGISTWIVAQKLAVPLRPINLNATFAKAKSKWKSLTVTVTISTLLSMISWGVGAVVGGVIGLVLAVPLYFLSKAAAVFALVICAVIGAAVLGIYTSARFMLVAPSIMMESISGKSAFRRSHELVKRAQRTVIATALLVYFVPSIFAFTLGIGLGAIVKSFDDEPRSNTSVAVNQEKNVSIDLNQAGVKIEENNPNQPPLTDEEKQAKRMRREFRETITGGIFEIIWIPITLLFTSFTSVITGMLYFKTRLAGGESMNDLLEQFEETEKPRKKWQERVRNRLIQSGRITSSVSKP